MDRTRVQYVCQSCGHASAKWLGRCPSCGEWNTLVEEVERAAKPASRRPTAAEPISVAAVVLPAETRASTGLAEFDRVLGGGMVRGSVVLVGGDPGIGKCLTADARVLDPVSGDFLPIVEWADVHRPVLSLDESSYRLGRTQVIAFHDQGLRPVVVVETRLGRMLRCTSNHPLLTPDGWKAVGELTAGSRIAAPRALPYFGRDSMPEHEVKAIAYFLSDGSAQSACGVTTALPEIEADLADMARRFDLSLRVYAKKHGKAKHIRFVQPRYRRVEARKQVATALREAQARAGMSWAEWARKASVSYGLLNIWKRGGAVPGGPEFERLFRAAGAPIAGPASALRERAEMKTSMARFLESVGLRYASAAEKAVPNPVFRLPREQLALFLRILFSCDGSAYVNRHSGPGISYSTISLRLARDVQHLLLRFGLIAKLRTKHLDVDGRPYQAYELQMLGIHTAKRFLAEIGILGREEARARIGAMATPEGASTHLDTVPTGPVFWEHVQGLARQVPYKRISAQAGVKIKNRRHDRPLTRRTVEALVTAFPHPYLSKIVSGDIYWDEIRSVRPAGSARVYDMTIDGAPNFTANDLIVHNSTLLLQVSDRFAATGGRVLYVSAEESVRQTKLRAERLGATAPGLLLLAENDLDVITETVTRQRPAALVVDSIQTVFRGDVASAPGSVAQVRECAAALVRLAKEQDVATFIVGHVTKEGALAGPRVLEHLVDTVLYFEGDRHHAYRILRATKNRFGSTNEIGVFEMAGSGLIEVPNPSAAFLSERPQAAPGSTVVCAIEGSRPLLVEVQALVSPTHFGMPRRTASGVDYNRVLLLLAVLERRAGLHLAAQDAYVSIAGGISVEEPAVDLGIAAAVASSLRDRPVDPHTVVIGEVGLAGEVRAVPQLGKRLAEAARLGFVRAVVPRAANIEGPAGLELVPVPDLTAALRALV